GYGYWGPNIVRNFSDVPGCQLAAVSDMRAERLASVRARYPAIRTFADANALIADRRIDAVVIVTPVSTHFDLAMQALRAGKHVLVEKKSEEHTSELQSLAYLVCRLLLEKKNMCSVSRSSPARPALTLAARSSGGPAAFASCA